MAYWIYCSGLTFSTVNFGVGKLIYYNIIVNLTTQKLKVESSSVFQKPIILYTNKIWIDKNSYS